jgi:hypothetical protein
VLVGIDEYQFIWRHCGVATVIVDVDNALGLCNADAQRIDPPPPLLTQEVYRKSMMPDRALLIAERVAEDYGVRSSLSLSLSRAIA